MSEPTPAPQPAAGPAQPAPAPSGAAGIKEFVLRVDALPHQWSVLAAILIGGAVGVIGYWLAQGGLLTIASTIVTAWCFAYARYTFAGRKPAEGAAFGATRSLLATIRADAAAFTASRSALARALMALGYALGFAALRELAALALGAMASPLLAIAAGLLMASIIASPVLWKAIAGSFAGSTKPAA